MKALLEFTTLNYGETWREIQSRLAISEQGERTHTRTALTPELNLYTNAVSSSNGH